MIQVSRQLAEASSPDRHPCSKGIMSDETEIIETEETETGPVIVPTGGLDYVSYQMLGMYGQGIPVSEIVNRMGFESPNTFYLRMKDFPIQYADAKRKLVELRIAKYRRIGALASDILMATLEQKNNLLSQKDTIKAELKAKQLQLSECPTKELEQDIAELESLLAEISEIDLKAMSVVAESAERRADLNEGNPTERIEMKPIEIIHFGKKNDNSE